MLNSDFKEFIGLLNAHEVRYLVVGGYAVALHGKPRYTKDLDLWLDRSPENANRIVQALRAFGFGSLDITVEDFLRDDHIIQLGNPPRRLDLLTSVPGVDFSECYARRTTLPMDGVRVDCIDLEGLRASKRASGRPQDLIDLDELG